jgi:hypothetical protein
MSTATMTRLAWLLQAPCGRWQGDDELVNCPTQAHQFRLAQTAADWLRLTEQPEPERWRLVPATLTAHPAEPHRWGLLSLHV